MSVRLWSLLVWALVGASAVYWALLLWAHPQALPAQTTLVAPPDLLQTSLARLGGNESSVPPAMGVATAATPAADGRFVLLGVVSPPGSGSALAKPELPVAVGGLALISVDGKPPRAYPVGAVVDGGLVLQAVSRRAASLGPAGQAAQVQLNLPEPAAALRGSPVRP